MKTILKELEEAAAEDKYDRSVKGERARSKWTEEDILVCLN